MNSLGESSTAIPLAKIKTRESAFHASAVHFTTPNPDEQLQDEMDALDPVEHPLFDALERDRLSNAKRDIKTP